MLTLKRKTGQRIILNDDIIITLLEVSGGSARIGITAPEHVKILREELVVAAAGGMDDGEAGR